MKLINWLNSIHLERIRQRVVVSGAILFLIIALDVHRFGAWYTGNQCHMKPYGFSLLCLATFPLILYAAAYYVQFCINRKLYTILYLTRIYFFCMIMSPFFAAPFLLNDNSIWYKKDLFRSDINLLYGIAILFLSPLLPVVCLAILGYAYKCVILISDRLVKRFTA